MRAFLFIFYFWTCLPILLLIIDIAASVSRLYEELKKQDWSIFTGYIFGGFFSCPLYSIFSRNDCLVCEAFLYLEPSATVYCIVIVADR